MASRVFQLCILLPRFPLPRFRCRRVVEWVVWSWWLTKCKPDTIQAAQKYKSWRHVLREMRRLVTLLLLRSPKFCSNFNRLKKVIEQFSTISLFDGGTRSVLLDTDCTVATARSQGAGSCYSGNVRKADNACNVITTVAYVWLTCWDLRLRDRAFVEYLSVIGHSSALTKCLSGHIRKLRDKDVSPTSRHMNTYLARL